MKIKAVLCDLDSTLADTRARAHLARLDSPNSEDWIPYSKACLTDVVVPGVRTALQLLEKHHAIFLVSGRNVEAEEETRQWLAGNDVPFDYLRLHTSTDILNNGDYKAGYVQKVRDLGFDPVLMFEDHIGVAEKVEAMGVPVITVNPRYNDTVGVNFNHLTEEDFV